MLKKDWGEVTQQTIQNCFGKSRISLKAQEGAMDDHDDPFKWMVDDCDYDSAVDNLECDLNQLCEARPHLAPENLDADELINFDREVATNESLPLSVDGIVSKNLPQPIETVEDSSSDEDEVPDKPISPPSRNKVDKAVEILNTLILLTKDLDLDPLLLKPQTKSFKEDWTELNNLLLVIFLKSSNCSILILIFL